MTENGRGCEPDLQQHAKGVPGYAPEGPDATAIDSRHQDATGT